MTKKLWKDVLTVSGIIFAVTAIFVTVMFLTPYWSYKIVSGSALGVIGTFLSFLCLALSVSRAVNKEKNSASVYFQGTYTLRFVLMAAVIIVGFKVPYFNGYATIVPFVAMQPSIMLTNMIFHKNKTLKDIPTSQDSDESAQ